MPSRQLKDWIQEYLNMNRQIRATISLGLCVLTLLPGCQPTQPFFFAEDGKVFGTGDLSHYLDVATEIEYPDVNTCSIDEVTGTQAPLSLNNSENFDIWELTLEEVTRITLTNSKVMRQLGGRITDSGSNIALSTPEILTQNTANAQTVYDPAIVESGNGTGSGSTLSGTGVEAALSQFDAMLTSSLTWNKNDRPQNFSVPGLPGFFAPQFHQDLGTGSIGITKNTANGSTFSFRNNYNYDQNNNGSRAQPSDWFTNFEASFNQPFLQGAGTQYNHIAGFSSFQQATAPNSFNQINGVLIARVRQDIALTDFEEGIRNVMLEVEDAYWELYFAYRDLDARKIGRDSALETWRKVQALKGVGTQGGEADKEAQARAQFFRFQAQVQAALTSLYRVENRLRYLMGLAPTDGRLIRPADEPTIAKIDFDWNTVLSEALARRAELREQKWQIKRREMELVASKNSLMPRLDATGTYRWLGAGDDLLGSNNGVPPFGEGSNAFNVLTGGRYQEWQLGLQFSMPIGFRRALAGVRHYQLLLARERAVLEDLELTIAHQLTDAIRDLDFNFQNTQTNFNSRVASQDEVDALRTVYEAGRERIDLLLDAQRRQADAESAYYRSLVDYNRAIMRVHYRKGSLLEYNSVYLAEGPWPGKAYFDALRQARQRDASTFVNYGYTRPRVISQGPYNQRMGQFEATNGKNIEILESPTLAPEQNDQQEEETMPLPMPIDPASGTLESLESGVDFVSLPGAEGSGAAELISLPAEVPPAAVSQIGYSSEFTPDTEPSMELTVSPPSTPVANPFRNPNRQEFTQWIDSNTRGLPPSEPIKEVIPAKDL